MTKALPIVHKDFFGRPLAVDDEVVCVRKNHRDLVKAKVVHLTPKMVRVVYKVRNGWDEDYLLLPGDVVKVPE